MQVPSINRQEAYQPHTKVCTISLGHYKGKFSLQDILKQSSLSTSFLYFQYYVKLKITLSTLKYIILTLTSYTCLVNSIPPCALLPTNSRSQLKLKTHVLDGKRFLAKLYESDSDTRNSGNLGNVIRVK